MTLLSGLFLFSAGGAVAATKSASKAPDLTFYGPVIDTCSHWTESKDDTARKIYGAAVLGELSGLENMCRLAKSGSLPFPCTGKKIQNAGQFAVSVANTCKTNPTHTIAEVTFVVWKWIATHDASKEASKKAKPAAKK
ncbi:membrane protein [Lasius niger]|uniref:Membrane protein n=1 Tax=Lasius niger TaxID=67767 RepID=A0A0J7KAM5_LASNI|nr:membrane protein [Lasius niger]